MAEMTEATSLDLEIVTAAGLFADTKVDMVTMSGTEGDFGVLPGHSPFFTMLRPGLIHFEEGGMPRIYCVTGGFAEVTTKGVTILARTCEKTEQIDKERVDRAKSEAETKLETLPLDDPNRVAVEDDLARADARLALLANDSPY